MIRTVVRLCVVFSLAAVHRGVAFAIRPLVVHDNVRHLLVDESLVVSRIPRGGGGGIVEDRKRKLVGTTTTTQKQAVAIPVGGGGGVSTISKEEANADKITTRPMHILFLSADTGGGHRASAEALAKQFLIQFPGSTYELVDLWTDHGVLPYKTLVPTYKRMSARPIEWKLFYHLSNTKLNEICSNIHSRITCGKKFKNRLASINPDVVVSVHPTMNHTPLKSIHKISKKLGKHVPFFTVVTDLGSAHCMWFERNVDKLYVASERLRRLAKRRGGTRDDDIVMTGLPIRHGFSVQSEQYGPNGRTSEEGKQYQRRVRQQLDLPQTSKTVLVMGGGEGVGSLSDIVDELYAELQSTGVDATICVVCGRNEKLKTELSEKNFDGVAKDIYDKKLKKRRRDFLKRIIRKQSKQSNDKNNNNEPSSSSSQSSSEGGKVKVVPLGFLTNIPEYMVAADVLVTKAGPGTIAEAAAVGLPIMMTSFLPGQEAGNVDVVLESGFGAYEKRPSKIANTVSKWLRDDDELEKMSINAKKAGNPYAANEIVADIGKRTVDWMDMNEQ